MMGLSVFELMESYNISFEEAQMLQWKILGIMILVALCLWGIQTLLKKYCPKTYKKLEELNIV